MLPAVVVVVTKNYLRRVSNRIFSLSQLFWVFNSELIHFSLLILVIFVQIHWRSLPILPIPARMLFNRLKEPSLVSKVFQVVISLMLTFYEPVPHSRSRGTLCQLEGCGGKGGDGKGCIKAGEKVKCGCKSRRTEGWQAAGRLRGKAELTRQSAIGVAPW